MVRTRIYRTLYFQVVVAILIGVLLVVSLLFRPGGLIGENVTVSRPVHG